MAAKKRIENSKRKLKENWKVASEFVDSEQDKMIALKILAIKHDENRKAVKNWRKLKATTFASRFIDQELESADTAAKFISYAHDEFDVHEILLQGDVLRLDKNDVLHKRTGRPLKTTAANEKQNQQTAEWASTHEFHAEGFQRRAKRCKRQAAPRNNNL